MLRCRDEGEEQLSLDFSQMDRGLVDLRETAVLCASLVFAPRTQISIEASVELNCIGGTVGDTLSKGSTISPKTILQARTMQLLCTILHSSLWGN